MSLRTGILCAICKEVFDNQDEIFSTSCGHLYHFLCMRECHTESANCSLCDSYKPCIFKMFLVFGDAPTSDEIKNRIASLYSELEGSTSEITELKEKCSMLQLTVQKLEGNMKKLNDALNSKSATVSDLQDRIATSEALNVFLNKDLELFKKKNENNSKSLEPGEKNSICKYGERVNPNFRNENADVNEHKNNTAESKRLNMENVSGNSKNSNENNWSFENGEQAGGFKLGTSITNTVKICNYPLENLKKYSLEKSVMFLARKMSIKLPNNAINSVISIKNSFATTTLIVYFCDIRYKNSFLKNKAHLKRFMHLKELEINE